MAHPRCRGARWRARRAIARRSVVWCWCWGWGWQGGRVVDGVCLPAWVRGPFLGPSSLMLSSWSSTGRPGTRAGVASLNGVLHRAPPVQITSKVRWCFGRWECRTIIPPGGLRPPGFVKLAQRDGGLPIPLGTQLSPGLVKWGPGCCGAAAYIRLSWCLPVRPVNWEGHRPVLRRWDLSTERVSVGLSVRGGPHW